ncbi:MAG: hypothetical protein R2854_30185 [Caldilineaceae bacterium]
MTPASQRPQSIDEISAAVRAASQVVPVGGGTKTGVLCAAAGRRAPGHDGLRRHHRV